ncbi:type II toxin-antitoxin system CcdA family antitoxin [Paracoccus actinidiae]|uniref:type II toxin-antitoxin system CcdA family antitoxin n=1 Tax=Paracoccus actinidiae TaxID=3064531 RepID=UPI0027D29DAB|nr:type II toxin-antitoxin system CcdA family antitoxin [Paracoccus sp. M09]
MPVASRRKTSLSLDAAALEAARDLGINVSAVADTALRRAVADVRRRQWLDDNADAFTAQADWHDRNGHPLADIMTSPGLASWKS